MHLLNFFSLSLINGGAHVIKHICTLDFAKASTPVAPALPIKTS